MDKITDIFEGPYMRKQRSKLNRDVLKKQRAIEAIGEFTGKEAALKTVKAEYREAYTKLITSAPNTPKELEEAPKKKAAKKKAAKKKTAPGAEDLM